MPDAVDRDATVGRSDEAAPAREHEDALWRFLSQLRDESERVRNEEAKLDQLERILDLFFGRHWPSTMPSYRPPVVANELRTLLLTDVNDLTESEPRVFVTRNNSQRDEQVERGMRAVWMRNQASLELMDACLWARALGTGFLEAPWDPNAADGRGDVLIQHVDPRYILPDPDAINDRTWLYVMKAVPLDLQDIRRLFPVTGMRVRPDDKLSEKQPDRTGSPTSATTPAYLGPLFAQDGLLSSTTPGYKKARAEVLDLLIRDDSVEEKTEEVTDPTTHQPILDEHGQKQLRTRYVAKYPHGRRIVGANRVILFDGDNPNVSGDYNLVRVVLEPTLGKFWGTGWISQTGEMNVAANKGLSSVVENALRLNNGTIVATTNTGIDWESFSGMPAQIVQKNPGSDFEIKYPPPMPADMVQFPFRMLDLQRRVLGFPDARMGVSARGNVSPELTETEISQAQSITRLANRMLYFAVQRLSTMVFARMAQGYTTRRFLPAVEGESIQTVEWQPIDEPKQYAVYVDPASFQVMSRTMLKRLSLAAYKLRMIDRQAALEMLGIPNAKAIAVRINEQEAKANYYREAGKKARGGK